MTGYVSVCTLADLPANGALIRVDIDGEPVVIVRSDATEVYAISDTCSHAEVALSDGDVDGRTIECWLHGSRFDLRTGAPIGLPATKPVPVYDIKLEGDQVYVSTAPSDALSIPNQESSR
ncbi:MAG: 3-phenylpropionate/trans-cinnamate dioxygenase ferredoxin component [Actinomycetota bacterium]|jgi:3-phenylpropionate/trans-cinnamate dioxygenase ferredoxin subunit|nr:3-phenylpropionate/trans-cinnamate dioxygenase ferredoxin component [Actinomycetota bacterium]